MPRRIAALIRHGDYHQLKDTPSAHQPFPLTEEGEQQARRGGDTLCGELSRQGWQPCPILDSSCLLRGWQTAQLMVEQLQGCMPGIYTVESFDALAERSMGSAANLSVSQIEEILKDDPRFPNPPQKWKSDSHYKLPLQGGESLLEAGKRVAAHLSGRMQGLVNETGDDVVKLFVGHGAAFRHAAYHLGVLSFDDIARLSMFHGEPVFLEFLDDGSCQQVAGEWKLRSASEGMD